MIGDSLIGASLIGAESDPPSDFGNLVLYATVPAGGTNVELRTNVLGSVQTMICAPAGQATCAFGTTNIRSIAATAHGVAAVTNNYLGSPFHISITSVGVGQMSDYLGSPFHMSSTSIGVGHTTAYLGSPFHISIAPTGVAAFTSNYLAGPIPFAVTTSHGVAAFSSNYLGSPFHVSMNANGMAHWTGNYLGSPFHVFGTSAGVGRLVCYLGSTTRLVCVSNGVAACIAYFEPIKLDATTSHGVSHVTMYLSSPWQIAFTAAGRAACTNNYMSGPTLLQVTSHGVAGFASNYMSGPTPMPGMVSNGAGSMAVYVSSCVYMFANTTATCGAAVSVYVAGPLTLQTASHGVGALAFADQNERFISAGVGVIFADLHEHGGVSSFFLNAGCYPPGVIFSMEGAHIYLAPRPIAGVAIVTWDDTRGVLAFKADAGCRAFQSNGTFFGVLIDDFGGVFAQLDNSADPAFVGGFISHSTMRGRSTMSIVGPEIYFACAAGCTYYDTYPADQVTAQPPYYPRGTGPTGDGITPVSGGVFATQQGPDYIGFFADGGSGHYNREFGNLVQGVFINLTANPNRMSTEADGVATAIVVVNDMRLLAVCIGDWVLNSLHVPSYDFEQLAVNGISVMLIDADITGPVAVAFASAGVGGFAFWYLSSHVYFETTMNGVAGCTRNMLYPDFDLDSNGGCYPYVDTGVHRHGVEFDMDQPLRGLFLVSHGVATAIAAVEGPQLLQWIANDKAHMTVDMTKILGKLSMSIVAGCIDYQVSGPGPGHYFVPTVGLWFADALIWTLYQPHDIASNGVATVALTPFWTLNLYWQKHGDPPLDPDVYHGPNAGTIAQGGTAVVVVDWFRWFLTFHTMTNIDSFPGTVPQKYKYPPDAWMLNVLWGMSVRSRGRTRLYWNYLELMGNLLARFFMIPQPWEPNIDGGGLDTSDLGYPINGYTMAGQFWPRHLKLPFRDVEPATHPNIWPDYEYWRR